MKQLFALVMIFALGYFYPVSVRGQGGIYSNDGNSSSVYGNTTGFYSQNIQQNSDGSQTDPQSGNGGAGVFYAPPGGGPPISGVDPIAPGFGTLMLLSFLYLFYKVVINFKKEEK